MTRDEARALADRVLALSQAADDTRVNITSEWGGNTRFADASITTSGGVTNVTVTVTVTGVPLTRAMLRVWDVAPPGWYVAGSPGAVIVYPSCWWEASTDHSTTSLG